MSVLVDVQAGQAVSVRFGVEVDELVKVFVIVGVWVAVWVWVLVAVLVDV